MSNPTLPLRPEIRRPVTAEKKPISVDHTLGAKLDRLMFGALSSSPIRFGLE